MFDKVLGETGVILSQAVHALVAGEGNIKDRLRLAYLKLAGLRELMPHLQEEDSAFGELNCENWRYVLEQEANLDSMSNSEAKGLALTVLEHRDEFAEQGWRAIGAEQGAQETRRRLSKSAGGN